MEFLEVLFAVVGAIFKRRRPARPPAAPSGAPPAPEQRPRDEAPNERSDPVAAQRVAAPRIPPASAPPAADRGRPGEVGLVTGLFASPRTLAAAFIVAEVLAKPVALRDD